jgi:hypothetical protein
VLPENQRGDGFFTMSHPGQPWVTQESLLLSHKYPDL